MSKYFKDSKRIDQLNEIEHWVTQQSGTERPGTGKYLKNKNLGIYVDIVSGEPLFSSDDKITKFLKSSRIFFPLSLEQTPKS